LVDIRRPRTHESPNLFSIYRHFWFVSAVLIGLPFDSSAVAQESPGSDESEQREIEEVVVTARFRQENVQDIGASIAAYDESLINRERLFDVQDIALRTVGMEVLDLGPNVNDINIRGISNGLPTGRGLKALATTFVDDVAVSGLGSGTATDFNTFDFARIEVLRGPQPTHFGEGSVGGTLRYFSNDPDLAGGFSGTARGGYSTTRHGDSSWRVDAALTTPLVEDQLALRLVGYHQDQGGFIDLPKLNVQNANTFESDGFRGVMLWEPSEAFSLRFSAHINRLDYGELNEIDPTQDGLDGSLGSENLYSSASIEASNFDNFDLYTLKMAYDFEHFTAESITGYFKRNLNTSAENAANTVGFKLFLENAFGVTDIDTTVLSLSDAQENTFSQEFRFISQFEGPLNFTAGLYYKDSDVDTVTALNSEGLAAILVPPTPNLYFSDTSDETRQLSAFVEFQWSVSERFRLIGGARYVREDFTTTINEQVLIQIAQFMGVDPETGYPQFPVGSDLDTLASFGLGNSFEFDLRDWLPRIALEYDISQDMLLYANAARGLRNGGLNSVVTAAFEAFDPETGEFDDDIFIQALEYAPDSVDSFELGLKTLLRDGRATINTAIFWSDYKDPQVLVGVPWFGVRNAPDADIWGIEFESTYLVGDHWTAYANAAYLNAEFTDSMRLTSVPGVPDDFEDLQKGNRPTNTPEWTFSVGADFEYPAGDSLTFFGHGSFSYVDERYGAVQNFPSTVLGSMEILNLSLGIRGDRWSLTLYGDNLLNDLEKQATVAPSNGAYIDENGVLDANLSQVFVNRPATVGLMLQVFY
jgi:iron complex outermembrane receptor protein